MKIPIVLLLVFAVFPVDVHGEGMSCVQCQGEGCDGNPEPTPCDEDYDACFSIAYPVEQIGYVIGKYCSIKEDDANVCNEFKEVLKGNGAHGVCSLCDTPGCNTDPLPKSA